MTDGGGRRRGVSSLIAVGTFTVALFACGGGGQTSGTSTTTAPPFSFVSATVPSTTSTTTTVSIAMNPALPGWPFHGLVVGPFESGTILFLPVGGGDSIEVVLTAGDVGCGLDLEADTRFVEVGLEYFGGGPQVEQFVWGAAASGVADRTLLGDEADLMLEAAGATIMIERNPTRTAIEVRTESGVIAQTEVASDRLTFAQLHGSDGRSVLVRLEPEEPACDRGVVYAINLGSGAVACTDGRMIAVQLVGQADPPTQPTVPAKLEPATDGCDTGTVADLLEVIAD